jgi:two-component system alkaline phosphatase synthesis response regulator PhoP
MKKKILIVDDEPVVLDILGKKLEIRNFEVVTARDGVQGMEMARSVSPDLILLDELMPNKDGMTMLQELKDDPELCKIPVIMVTARRAARDKSRGESLGATAYVMKPVGFYDILQYIEWYTNQTSNQ